MLKWSSIWYQKVHYWEKMIIDGLHLGDLYIGLEWIGIWNNSERAASENKIEAVNTLIELGEDVNDLDANGGTALHLSAGLKRCLMSDCFGSAWIGGFCEGVGKKGSKFAYSDAPW